jgi:uncharacterized coiled-coil protein SlyX
MSDSRIQFESKVAILEHTVDALGGELLVQQRRLDALQATVEALVQQLNRLRSGGDAVEPHDTRPPHWGG